MKTIKNCKTVVFLIAAVFTNPLLNVQSQAQKDSSKLIKGGQIYFMRNCAVCHTIGKGKLVGPDLKGVENRHTLPWLLKWIHSSKTLIKANDREAITLFEVNNKVPMPNQPLSEHQITMVIDYIKSVDKIVPVKALSKSTNSGTTVASPSTASKSSASSVSIGDGEQLFKQNCASCHTIGKGKLVGPDLKGVEDRHPLPWLLKWIHSSQALIKGNDKDAAKLFADNNQMQMPDQLLNQQQITSVINYIKSVSNPGSANSTNDSAKNGNTQNIAAAPVPASTSASKTEEKTTGDSTLTIPTNYLNYIWIGLAAVFLIVIYVLASIIKVLVNPSIVQAFKGNLESTALNMPASENFTEGYYPVYHKSSLIKMVVKKVNDEKHSALCTWMDEIGYNNEGVFEFSELTKLRPEV